MIFFPRYKDIKRTFFVQQHTVEDYCTKKMDKSKITQPIKKLQKTLCEYYRDLSEDEKINQENYANTKSKNTSGGDRERKKYSCMKNYSCKRKKLLNHLPNLVEELRKVCLNKQIFKYCESLLDF